MNNQQKLSRDLQILTRFAEELEPFLGSNTLFWRMGPHWPELSIGGCLMRRHRLRALHTLLEPAEQAALEATVAQIQAALNQRIVAFEQKAQRELDARLRQWVEYLGEIETGKEPLHYYATAVEARVMLHILMAHLEEPPYQLTSTVPERLMEVDKGLRARWVLGDFVWPEGWQPAYPAREFWYLYGRPEVNRQP
jgi:hypothetical protein